MFGYFGITPMGLVGAAWATVIALCYRTVRLAIPLLMPSFHDLYHTRETWRPSWSHIADLFRVGMPVALQWTSEILVWTLFVSVLIGRFFGTADLIATNATWQYLRLAFLPTVGVGQSLTALVGKAIGAGDTERAMRDTRFAAILTVVYMGAIAVFYAAAGSWLIGLFSEDLEVIRVGRWVMVCAAAFQIFDALAITYVSALRGAGDTFIPSIFLSVSLWVVVIGAGWGIAVLFPGLRSIGPWMAAAALIMLTSFFLWWRWSCGAWRKLDIFRAATAD
ncbi:MAG: MATE family efflux transporter, partial [Planctomycetota bacterium]